jgi:hypothetical protein
MIVLVDKGIGLDVLTRCHQRRLCVLQVDESQIMPDLRKCYQLSPLPGDSSSTIYFHLKIATNAERHRNLCGVPPLCFLPPSEGTRLRPGDKLNGTCSTTPY